MPSWGDASFVETVLACLSHRRWHVSPRRWTQFPRNLADIIPRSNRSAALNRSASRAALALMLRPPLSGYLIVRTCGDCTLAVTMGNPAKRQPFILSSVAPGGIRYLIQCLVPSASRNWVSTSD